MRKIVLVTATVILIAAVSMSLVACFGADDKIAYAKAEYENYPSGFAYASKTPTMKETSLSASDEALLNDEDYDIEYQTVKATASYDDLCTMGVDSEILYPGALVDIKTKAYRPLKVERASLTISANLESTIIDKMANLSATVKNPSLSTARQGIREIVGENLSNVKEVPSNLSIDIREVSSEKEFYLNLGFGLQVSKLSIAENFSYDKLNKQTNLVIVLKQIYYTIDVDYEGEKGFFSDNLHTSEINKELEGSIPAYVSSVSYGRIAIITIQTNYSKEEITNELRQAWGKNSDNPGGTTRKKFSEEFDSELKSIANDKDTKINCFFYGGEYDINSAITAITANSTESLATVFNKMFDSEKILGLPISYRLRHLDGTLAKVQDAQEYTTKKVTYNPKKLMDFDTLDSLIESGDFLKNESLKLDFSALVNYKDISDSVNSDNVKNNANRTITIPANVNDLYLIGPNQVTGTQVEFNNLSFLIASRKSKELIIHLKDISFNADPRLENAGGAAIQSKSDAKITLDIDGDVLLRGAGGHCLEAEEVEIRGYGELTLIGGNGDSGKDGFCAIRADRNILFNMDGGSLSFFGGDGGDGQNGASWKRDKNENQNNNNGRDGESGDKGGNGGECIAAASVNILNADKLTLTLKGGNGGRGGNGGDGEYAPDYGEHAGRGGDGGNGGIGGSVLIDDSWCVDAALKKMFVSSGNGGNGGNGGDGGHADKYVIVFAWSWSIAGQGGDSGLGGGPGIIENSLAPNVSVLDGTNGCFGLQGTSGSKGNDDFY